VIGRRLLLSTAAAGISAAALGCGSRQARTDGAERIAIAGGALTEIAFALGAGPAVVGTDTSSTYPTEASTLPKFGYQRQLAAEGVLSLSPSLVLASDEAGPPEVLEQLRGAGVKVHTIGSPKEAAAISGRVAAVGAALDRRDAGARLSAEVGDAIADLAAKAAARSVRPRVLFLYARGQGTLMVGGRGTSAQIVLDLVGCTNAAADVSGFLPLTPEAAIAAKPAIVLVPEKGLASLGGKDGLFATPGLSDTPAAQSKRVVAIDDLLLLGLGPRVARAIEDVAAQVFA
jgi:iron complex transport system substrate-binding protein